MERLVFSPEMSVFVISVLTALMVSCFCSLMESVLLSLSPSQIFEISEKYPKIGEKWNYFKTNINTPISAILILNTTAHTIGATIAGNSLASILADSGYQKTILWIFSFTFTFLMLQYTEILPKTLGVRYNKFLAVRLVWPLSWMITLATPISVITQWFNKPFEPKGREVDYASIDELRCVVQWAKGKRLIREEQANVILETTKLSLKKASDIMIPLQDVVFLASNLTLEEAIDVAYVDAHTRFPVCENGHRNKIIGYVNFKEIIAHQKMNPGTNSFQPIIRPIIFINGNAPASDLLPLFTTGHEHLAMVRNEKGNCIGMVTLEDIIEELIGEREDEFDNLPLHIHHLPNHTLALGGGCKMHKVRRMVSHDVLLKPSEYKGREFVAEKDDGDTLDSWLGKRLGHTPVRGDQIMINGVEFNIRRVRRGHVFDVHIRKSKHTGTDEND